tara:strand:- start:2316 stop:3314 length:999 start_codon:yes stop_codon:yes gene_type:complete
MIHRRSIKWLLESLDKESIESIIPKEKRKTWKKTESEDDYTKRSPRGAHRRAAGALMWLDPRSRKSFLDLENKGIKVVDSDLSDYSVNKTEYDFNISAEDINVPLLISNWRRLKVRQLWQDAVYSNTERAKYWSDSSKVRCIHNIGFFNSGSDPLEECVNRLERMIQYSQNNQKAELSCIGLVKSGYDNQASGNIAIEFTNRKIVWASESDAWTQFLSSANDNTRNYFQVRKEIEKEDNPMAQKIFDAVLVKFPSETNLHDKILFSEYDVLEMKRNYIHELIITDWDLTPDDVIITIPKSVSKSEKPRLISRIQQLAKKYFGSSAEFLIDNV